jgi:hypothetical protein
MLAGLFVLPEVLLPSAFILVINAPRIVVNLVAVTLIAKNLFEDKSNWQMLSHLTPYLSATLVAFIGGPLILILSVSMMASAATLLLRPDRSLSMIPQWTPYLIVCKAAIGLGLLDLLTQLYVRILTLVFYEVAVPLQVISHFGVFQLLLEASTIILGPLVFMFHNHVCPYGLFAPLA